MSCRFVKISQVSTEKLKYPTVTLCNFTFFDSYHTYFKFYADFKVMVLKFMWVKWIITHDSYYTQKCIPKKLIIISSKISYPTICIKFCMTSTFSMVHLVIITYVGKSVLLDGTHNAQGRCQYPRALPVPKGERVHIRQCTSTCVTTNMLHIQHSKICLNMVSSAAIIIRI